MAHALDSQRLGDHLDRLFRAAWALTGSRVDAEDLVQETYANVLARPRFVRNENDLAYLLRALRNTFIAQKRKQGRRPRTVPLLDDFDPAEQRTGGDPQAAAEAADVLRAIASLAEDHREVITAVDVAGLSYDEAARALKVPIGTVMSRLYRARQQLVRRLGGDAE